MLPIQIVDKGAIKFILSGAHIMCPGITSPGAFLNHETPKGTPVQVNPSSWNVEYLMNEKIIKILAVWNNDIKKVHVSCEKL